jgi:hypothetical protein
VITGFIASTGGKKKKKKKKKHKSATTQQTEPNQTKKQSPNHKHLYTYLKYKKPCNSIKNNALKTKKSAQKTKKTSK